MSPFRRARRRRLPYIHQNTYHSRSLGCELGEWATYRALLARRQLKKLPGISKEDFAPIAQAAWTIFPQTRELDQLDEQLLRASNNELKDVLLAVQPIGPARDTSLGVRFIELRPESASQLPNVQRRLLAWAEVLPEPNRTQMRAVCEERLEIVTSLFAMCASLDRTTQSIDESFRKHRLAHSSQALEDARPQLPLSQHLDRVREAEQTAQLARAAVESMYPALESLESSPLPPSLPVGDDLTLDR